MATFHLKVKNVSKHKSSAVAKAAYTSGDKLYSEREDENKNYRTRSVAPESFIMAPSHAPEFVYDREKLWNEAEKIERAYNARVMKEIVVALPVEIPDEEQTKLVKKFVKEALVDDGMVVDVSIHRDQEHNPHAHLLCTVRPFDDNGEWVKAKSKKEYLLDDKGNRILNEKGNFKTRNVDVTGWNSPEKIVHWREKFSEYTNESYKLNGLNIQVSHLSNEDIGIEKLPKQRLTRSEYYIEKNAKENAIKEGIEYHPITYYGKLNNEIEIHNNTIDEINNSIQKIKIDKRDIYKSSIDFRTFTHKITGDVYNTSQSQKDREFVKLRSKSYTVNYEIANKTSRSLDYWKKSIDTKLKALDREKKILESALHHYKNNSKELSKLGFIHKDFVTQYNQKAKELDQNYKDLLNEFDKYKVANQSTKNVVKNEKDILRNQFIYLYPDYKEFAELRTRKVENIMAKTIDDFTKDETVKDSIPDVEKFLGKRMQKELLFIDKVSYVLDQYKEQSIIHFTLKNKVENLENTYKEKMKVNKNRIFESQDARNDIYNSALEFLLVKDEAKVNEEKYNETKIVINDLLIELYGKNQSAVIEKLPDRIKANLLEGYTIRGERNNLDDDLLNEKWKLHNGQQEQSNSNLNSLGNILSDLINQAQQNQNDNDVNGTSKRRKNMKGRKLTKEELLDFE